MEKPIRLTRLPRLGTISALVSQTALPEVDVVPAYVKPPCWPLEWPGVCVLRARAGACGSGADRVVGLLRFFSFPWSRGRSVAAGPVPPTAGWLARTSPVRTLGSLGSNAGGCCLHFPPLSRSRVLLAPVRLLLLDCCCFRRSCGRPAWNNRAPRWSCDEALPTGRTALPTGRLA